MEGIKAFQAMYNELTKYVLENGHANIPYPYRKNRPLAKWVKNQKKLYSENELPKERAMSLQMLGLKFDFTPPARKSQTSRWEERFREFEQYVKEHGHANIPTANDSNHRLICWATNMRRLYRKKKLPEDRLKCLQILGFEFDVSYEVSLEALWNERFDELAEYAKEHGNADVPSIYDINLRLGRWVAYQRKRHKHNKMSRKEFDKLQTLGFKWVIDYNPHLDINNETCKRNEETWKDKFKELGAFMMKHGHINIPTKGHELSNWVVGQRELYRADKLSSERFKKLQTIGFHFGGKNSQDPNTQAAIEKWDERFSELERYKEKHGNCSVPVPYPPNINLGHWVSKQRHMYRQNRLLVDFSERLNSLGFDFNINLRVVGRDQEKWEKHISDLVDYVKEHGNSDIPKKYDKNPNLSQWAHNQRSFHNRGLLSEDRFKSLLQAGFNFKDRSRVGMWWSRYNELAAYVKEHGNDNVPVDCPLGEWAMQQRKRYHKNKVPLSDGRLEKLQEIGFNFALSSNGIRIV